MNRDAELRKQLVALLTVEQAHVGLDAAIEGLPLEARGRRPAGAAHSPWEVLEHLRIAQWDILEFSRDAKHVSPEWPSGYWPATVGPPDEEAWERSVAAFRRDLAEMVALVEDEGTDLMAGFAWDREKNLLREVLVLGDHNAYHVGEMVVLKRELTD